MLRVHNSKNLFETRRKLRSSATPAEKVLWNELKQRKFYGCKFRRQHSIGPFIIDFYCPEHRIAIELDGRHHELDKETKEKDLNRTIYLKNCDIEVVRFTNEEIFENLGRVLGKLINLITK